MPGFLRRIRWYFSRRRYEQELADELRFHAEQAREHAEHAGATPAEARAAAQRRLGSTARAGESARSEWGFAWLDGLTRDLRYAGRTLRRRPMFAIATVLTLALGIGATTALWSVLDPVLLRPLPYSDSDRLVALLEVHRDRPEGQTIVSPANALNWRERTRALQDAGLYTWTNLTLVDDPPEELDGLAVTTNLFGLLGAVPFLGRGFSAEDTLPDAPRAVLISHALWQRRFGGDPAVVGRPLRVRGRPAIVIGVMPADFRALEGEAYWVPLPIRAEHRVPRGRYVMAIGRLAAGQTAATVTGELEAVARGLKEEYPAFNAAWTARAVPLAAQITGKARPVLWLLAAAIGFVLLVACANVANLHLGQAIARRGELALRAALGASRPQVMRQWLVEGLLLAGLGGLLGVGLAAAGIRALVNAQVAQIPRLEAVGLDLRVLGFAALVTILAGLICGLAPALVVRETRLRGMIGTQSGPDAQRGTGRLRTALVVAQVTLCFALLTGAGLAIRSLRQVLDQETGFDPARLLTFRVTLSGPEYTALERRTAFFADLEERIRALPGVQAVGASSVLPLAGIQPATSYRIVGEPEPEPGQGLSAQVTDVSPGYLPAVGIPVLQGRGFDPGDRAGAARVVLVSRSLAEEVAAKQGAGTALLGRQVKVSWREPDSAFTIVGVVGDVRTSGLDVATRPLIYFVTAQSVSGSQMLSVRATGDPLALVPALRAQVAALDAGLPITDLSTMSDRVGDSVAARRYPMLLLLLLGGLALVLGAIGLYGVLAYAVSQRQRELGIRRALGANQGDVVRLVLGSGLRMVALGLGIGLITALATTRFMQALLFEVSPRDPVTFGVAGLLVTAVTFLACWIPARRATRADPVAVFRGE
jgi:predicted permease